MEQKVRLSYVVPVFNMEKYLKQCISSILDNVVDCSEIILVNDGSWDHSLDICREYERAFSFVRVVDKQNGGISSARNVGLELARGEYVCFVDSDDYYTIKFADRFLDICMKNDLDIIRGIYGIYDEEEHKFIPSSFSGNSFINQVLLGNEFLYKSINEHANEVVPWLGFFRREYLIQHNVKFPEGIAYEEDQLFFLKALLCDPDCRVMQTEIEFYAYRRRAGSATKTPTIKQAQDVVYVVEQETKLLNSYGVYDEAAYRYICSSFYQLTSIYGRVPKEDKKQIAKIVPMWMKWQCICHPYDRHQQIKIVLFTFARWYVDWVYKRRGIS